MRFLSETSERVETFKGTLFIHHDMPSSWQTFIFRNVALYRFNKIISLCCVLIRAVKVGVVPQSR